MNRDLPENFKEKDIVERAKKLADSANKIWKLPTTSISLEKKEVYYTILDNLTYKKLSLFNFLNVEYIENSFLGMLKKIVEILLEEDDKKLINLIQNNKYVHLKNHEFKANDNLIIMQSLCRSSRPTFGNTSLLQRAQ